MDPPQSREGEKVGNALSVPDVFRERRCLQNKPRETCDHKRQKKDKKSEFPSLKGSGVSREVGQKFRDCKNTEKFDISGVCLREDKNSRTQIPDNNSNFWNLRP